MNQKIVESFKNFLNVMQKKTQTRIYFVKQINASKLKLRIKNDLQYNTSRSLFYTKTFCVFNTKYDRLDLICLFWR